MNDYMAYTSGLYPSSSNHLYNKINISNYDYAKYSKSSLVSSKGVLQTHTTNAGSKLKNDSITRPSSQHTEHSLVSASGNKGKEKVELSAPVGNNKTISKTYQKYRSLLLSRKSSLTSISKCAAGEEPQSVTILSLPDEVLQLISVYVSTGNSYFATPYDSSRFFASTGNSGLNSNTGKRSFNVTFNLTPIHDNNDTSLLNVVKNCKEIKIKKPNANDSFKAKTKYVNQVLNNYKNSKHYQSTPNKNLLSLLYVNKRFYRLALPLVYKEIVFHSSYRLAQFITTIRGNNMLGLLVEKLDISQIDTLYYFCTNSHDDKSYVILTEQEKNKIDQLINSDQLSFTFDGTFDKLDMDLLLNARLNIQELNTRNVNILSLISNDYIDFNNELEKDPGVKKKMVLGSWRQWKFRSDQLYSTSIASVELYYKDPMQNAHLRNSSSLDSIRSRQSQQQSTNSITRTFSRNSSSSFGSVSTYFKNDSDIAVKFRRIISKFNNKKKVESVRKSKMTPKLSKKDKSLHKRTEYEKESKLSQTNFELHQYPVRHKLLLKYSCKDIPMGYIIHLMKICQSLQEFDMSKTMLATDYEIIENVYDDYGVLLRAPKSGRSSIEIDGSNKHHMRSYSDADTRDRSTFLRNRSSSVNELSDRRNYSLVRSTGSVSNYMYTTTGDSMPSTPTTPTANAYTGVLKEINDAYGTSIYSQFNSVIPRTKGYSFFPDTSSATGTSSGNGGSLDFYKDPFGYSNQFKLNKAKNDFYRDFLGYSNSKSRIFDEDYSKEVDAKTSMKFDSFQESGYSPMIESSAEPGLESKEKEAITVSDPIPTRNEIHGQKETSFAKMPVQEIIEEEDSTDNCQMCSGSRLKSYLNDHLPLQLDTKYQADKNLNLSDVRKVNNWGDDQLRKITNFEIIEAASKLQHMHTIRLNKINWITTKDVQFFVDHSKSIEHKNLKKIDLSHSGMRRDMNWALEGSVKQLKRALNPQPANGNFLNIGRNYSHW